MTLPIVDLEGLAGAEVLPVNAARALDVAFCSTGFCYVTNTGVSNRLIEQVFATSHEFHALPIAAKRAVVINAFHRGYMAPKSSTIKSSSVAKVKQPNLSESLMVMHNVSPESVRYGEPLQGPNQWPVELANIESVVTAYIDEMSVFARRLTQLMAVALGLADDHFDAEFVHPTIWLRLLHYPPQPVFAPADQYGAAPHTDYGFFTLLAQDDNGGLEVRNRSGEWVVAPPIAGTFVLNVADMLARMTANRWPSTPHRVRNLTGRERYSVPFFWDTDMRTQVSPIAGLDGDSNAYPEPVVYGDYVMERLNRNYAYRQATTTLEAN